MQDDVRILLVEDNEADADLIRYTFKKNKIRNELIHVEDGEEAIDYVLRKGKYEKAKIPDLIILDINLPKVNGIEVLKKIKADQKAKIIPVIILTTSDSEEDIHSAYENYASAYLVKPVEIDDFIMVITKLEQFMIKVVKHTRKEETI